MKWVTEILFYFLRSLVYRQTMRSIQRKGILAYLKALQVIRKTLAGSLFVYLFLQLMLVGFVGSVVVGIFLLPEELNIKLWILLSIFGVFFLVPLICLMFLFSEKVWYRLSGAEQMLTADEEKDAA